MSTQQEPNIYVYENLIDKGQIVPITHPDFYTRVSDEPFAPPCKHDAGDLLWTGVDFIPGITNR